MPRGRKPKGPLEVKLSHEDNTEAAEAAKREQEAKTAAEKAAAIRKAAEQYLFEDEDMKVVFRLLKQAAEKGNPVARTLYGMYNLFIGSNIPEKQDEAYAEAVKWFYMNRKGELECNMLQSLIRNTLPTKLVQPEQVYDNALRMAELAKNSKGGYFGTMPSQPNLY